MAYLCCWVNSSQFEAIQLGNDTVRLNTMNRQLLIHDDAQKLVQYIKNIWALIQKYLDEWAGVDCTTDRTHLQNIAEFRILPALNKLLINLILPLRCKIGIPGCHMMKW